MKHFQLIILTIFTAMISSIVTVKIMHNHAYAAESSTGLGPLNQTSMIDIIKFTERQNVWPRTDTNWDPLDCNSQFWGKDCGQDYHVRNMSSSCPAGKVMVGVQVADWGNRTNGVFPICEKIYIDWGQLMPPPSP